MKIALSAEGNGLDYKIDERFGRSLGFIIYDLDQESLEHVENRQNREAAQGAGIQAARTIVDSGASVLVTGHVGPKAFAVLKTAGVEIYTVTGATVREGIERYREGVLKRIDSADVEGHW